MKFNSNGGAAALIEKCGAVIPIKHQSLLRQLVRREVLGRYRGSLLGVAWSFITPLCMLGIYTFVFVHVFKARWAGAVTPADPAGGVEFALQLYTGLILFNVFAETLSRSAGLIVEQSNLVKKIVFPLEILSWVSVLSAMFHLMLNTAVLLSVVVLARGQLPLTIIALPLLAIAFLPMLLGFSWVISALGVYVRDVGPLIGMVLGGLMFLTPVFYPVSALPAFVQDLIVFNPPTLLIEQARRVLMQGLWPQWDQLLAYFVVSLAVAAFGALFFKKLRNGFADVL